MLCPAIRLPTLGKYGGGGVLGWEDQAELHFIKICEVQPKKLLVNLFLDLLAEAEHLSSTIDAL